MSKLHSFSKELKTKQLFESKRARTGGAIFIGKGHLIKSLCMKTLISEINRRAGFVLMEYGSFYLVLCNSGTGTVVSTK